MSRVATLKRRRVAAMLQAIGFGLAAQGRRLTLRHQLALRRLRGKFEWDASLDAMRRDY